MRAPKRSFFDLSHEVKMSGKMSYLYPILVTDCLPGDTFRNDSTIMMRFAPMLAPIMHRVNVTTHFFFVPNRLLYDGWEDFITGGQDGVTDVTTPYLAPNTILAAGTRALTEQGTLWDYLGLPPSVAAGPMSSPERVSALPFMAYSKVWSDYYRDPNFDTEIEFPMAGGDMVAQFPTIGNLKRRGWRKDYFTSALPWAQRGQSVLIPLSGLATEVIDDNTGLPADNDLYLGTMPAPFDPGRLAIGEGFAAGTLNTGTASLRFDNSEITINDLRTSLALQSWLENNARGGARYVEQIQSHFSVRVPDYRLQRAEYLGGGMQAVQISEVLSTTKNETEEQPLGEMGGHAVSVGRSNQFTYRCQEHGWILGVMSVMPEPAYSQGIDKMWLREDKYDYAWPELANLGEQEILSKELFYSFDIAQQSNNLTTFGYIPRYSEYKFKNDRIAGDFRNTLSFWHLGRIFSSRPFLASEFTTGDEAGTDWENDMRRVFAVQDGTDYLWIDIFHRFTAKRPLPYFGVPQLRG